MSAHMVIIGSEKDFLMLISGGRSSTAFKNTALREETNGFRTSCEYGNIVSISSFFLALFSLLS